MLKIGKEILSPRKLRSGVPQGSIISLIIFTIYCADLKEWVRHSKLLNYADNTGTSNSSQEIQQIIENLEEHASNILQFMASNGLVANLSKTESMMLNNKSNETIRKIKVGMAEVQEVKSAKLLSITMENYQKWRSHFWGKKRLLQSLNQRLIGIGQTTPDSSAQIF